MGQAEPTLSAFAERVLFGETLADKLLVPGRLDDSEPGPPRALPPFPGRPAHLRPSERRLPFPAAAALRAPRAQGEVLHFFANHELLAIELMAAMILRFPDAPAAFRRGLLATLAEEQAHLAAYLAAMDKLGVSLGDVPVNAFFWRCLAHVTDPLAYVAGMGLVFEQANLDHALAWRDRFTEAGAPELAALLQRVHDDEVGHVRFGLHWFDRWRDPREDRMVALERALPEPLSPARARGEPFVAESRRLAGLDDGFIEALRLYRRSRGRPPDVWSLQVDAEGEVLRGEAAPPQAVANIEADLASIAIAFAHADDVVVVPRLPGPTWRSSIAASELPLPELVPVSGLPALAERRLGALRPFAASPRSLERLQPLAAAAREPAGPAWSAARAHTFSKRFGAELARALGPDPIDLPAETLPVVVTSLEDALEAIEAARRHTGVAVAKAAWAASGRGHLLADPTTSPGALRPQLAAALASHGALVVEPWLERVADLGVQLELGDDGRARIVAITRAWYDGRGRFVAAATHPWQRALPPEVHLALGGGPRLAARLAKVAEHVGSALFEAGHRGPAGFDAFVARWAGGLGLRPLVEVNPRLTMGRVAYALGQRLRAHRFGLFAIAGRAELRRAGVRNLHAWLSLAAERARPLNARVLPLADPQQASALLPVLVSAANEADCWSILGTESADHPTAAPRVLRFAPDSDP